METDSWPVELARPESPSEDSSSERRERMTPLAGLFGRPVPTEPHPLPPGVVFSEKRSRFTGDLIKTAPTVVDPDAYYANLRQIDEARQSFACERCRDAGIVRRGGEIVACRCRCTGPVLEARLRATGLWPIKTFAAWHPYTPMDPMVAATREIQRGERWCLFVRSSVGSGKTHVAQAAMHEWVVGGREATFWNVPELLRALRHTHNPKAEQDLEVFMATRVLATSLLVLDDTGAERPTEFATEQIYTIVDAVYRRRPQHRLIVTTNVPPENDELIDRRTLDRLSAGEVIIRGAASRRREFDR